jgi:hypothetical protein
MTELVVISDTDGSSPMEHTMPVEMKFHEACNSFPKMEPADFNALVKDIELNGLTEEIWTMPEMVTILDGKHRYLACLKAVDLLPGLKEQAKERMRAGGGDQRSGAEIIPDPIADIGDARSKAAERAKVNEHYISDAEQIAREDPDLLKRVQGGTLTIPAAKKKLAAKKKSPAQGKSKKPKGPKNNSAAINLRSGHDPREAADLAYDNLRNDRLSLEELATALTTIIKISKPAMTALVKAHSDCAGITTDDFIELKLRELFSAGVSNC